MTEIWNDKTRKLLLTLLVIIIERAVVYAVKYAHQRIQANKVEGPIPLGYAETVRQDKPAVFWRLR